MEGKPLRPRIAHRRQNIGHDRAALRDAPKRHPVSSLLTHRIKAGCRWIAWPYVPGHGDAARGRDQHDKLHALGLQLGCDPVKITGAHCVDRHPVPDFDHVTEYPIRSEERRVGKEVCSKCRYWWMS